MTRQLRMQFPEGVFHVYGRGNNKEEIFLSPEDYEAFLARLRDIKRQCPFCLLAYCLMPNHYHFALQLLDARLSTIMQRLLTGYARDFNARYARVGHVFQGRFGSRVCAQDDYLITLVKYIHRNPIEAGLCASVGAWPYSSHNAYLGEADGLTDPRLVLGLLDPELERAEEVYARLVATGESVLPDLPAASEPMQAAERRDGDLSLLAEEVARRNRIDIPALRGRSKNRSLSLARQAFIEEALKRGASSASIARFLGRSPSGISHFLSRNANNVNNVNV